jgi:PAS domain S-box-containing protein
MNHSKTPDGNDSHTAASADPNGASTAASAWPRTTIDKAAVRRRAIAALREGRFDLLSELFDHTELDRPALIENLSVYHAELQIQNDELRASEQQALTALARYTALFCSLPIGVLVIDGYGLVLDANTRAREMLGLRDIRAHQHFLLRLVNPDDRTTVTRAIQHLDHSDGEVVTAVRLESIQSGRVQADLHFVRPSGDAPDSAHAICAIVDQIDSIRQRDALVRTNAQLEHSQERYRVLADFSPDWDYWMSREGAYVYVSPACEEITGYSAEQFRADPDLFEHILHPDDRPIWQAHVRELEGSTEGAAPCRQREGPLHFRVRTRNGQERWIEHVCRAVTAPDGHNLGRRGVNRDITERVRADAALRESERRYRALFESAGEGMVILQDGVFKSFNRAALTMIGYRDEREITGKRPADISPATQPDGEPSELKEQRLLARCAAGEVQRTEWEHLRANGEPMAVQMTLIPIALDDGDAILALWFDPSA